MAGLPTLTAGGRMTAAVASQISDGASAVLLASDRAVKDHNLLRGRGFITSVAAEQIPFSC